MAKSCSFSSQTPPSVSSMFKLAYHDNRLMVPIRTPYVLKRNFSEEYGMTKLNGVIAVGKFGFIYSGVRNDKRVAVKEIGVYLHGAKPKHQRSSLKSLRALPHHETVSILKRTIPPKRMTLEAFKLEVAMFKLLSYHRYGLDIIDGYSREKNNSAFLISELCLGSISALFFTDERKAKLNSSMCTFIMFPIYCAIKYLHDNFVLHLNITLDNILLTYDFVPKLTGLSGCLRIEPGKKKLKDVPRETVGVYSAPEFVDKTQFFGKKADHWSLSVSLLTLYTKYSIDMNKTFIFELGKDQSWIKQEFEKLDERNEDLESFILSTTILDPKKRPSLGVTMKYNDLFCMTKIALENKKSVEYLSRKSEIAELLKEDVLPETLQPQEKIPKRIKVMYDISRNVHDNVQKYMKKTKEVKVSTDADSSCSKSSTTISDTHSEASHRPIQDFKLLI